MMRFTSWFLTAGISGVILLLVGWINGYGIGWLGVLAGTGDTGKSFWSPMGIVDTVLTDLLLVFGLDADWTLDTLRVIGRLSSVVIVLALMFWGRDKHIVQRMTWAFTALVVLSPIIHLVPALAASALRGDRHPQRLADQMGLLHRWVLHLLRRPGPAACVAVPGHG